MLGDRGDVRGLGDAVLLEGPVDGVAGEQGVGAQRLVRLLAELAGQARAVEPLDAGVVADLDVLDELALGDDDARALVAADKRHLGGQRPVALHGVQVGVADARVLDVDEHLIGAGLADGDLLVDEGAAALLDDLGPLGLGDDGSSHGVSVVEEETDGDGREQSKREDLVWCRDAGVQTGRREEPLYTRAMPGDRADIQHILHIDIDMRALCESLAEPHGRESTRPAAEWASSTHGGGAAGPAGGESQEAVVMRGRGTGIFALHVHHDEDDARP